MKRYTPFFILALLGVLAMACITSASLASYGINVDTLATPSPVTISLPPTPEKVTTSLPFCTVTAKALNLRAGPGTSYSVIDWLRAGDVLTVTQDRGGWLQVIDPSGAAGWVNQTYCTIGE